VAWEAERLRKRDPQAALVFLQKELARRPTASLELKMAYPRLLVGSKQFVEARQEFEALLQKNPRQPELLYSAGLLAFQLNDLPTARTELEGALNGHYPDADFLRYSLGQISEGLKDLPAARHWYGQVGPGVQYLSAQVRLGFLEAQAGQVDAGLTRIGKLGNNDAERLQLVLIQSEIAREARLYARAESLLTKALRRYPRSPELLYERSLVGDLQNQPAAAERDLRSLLKIRPRDEQALNALGYILANRTARYDEAYSLISRALKLAPDNPMIIDSMGWVLYKQGRLDEALRYLMRAYAALPDQEVAAHYGEVLWKLGRQEEARALWTRAASQASGAHPQLDETMKRLLPK
jgi:tetratricopeptide (TPR) repeat protein